MRIVMDVDGVCADFTGYLLRSIGSRLRPADVTTWQVLDLLTLSERTKALALLDTTRWWIGQPTLPGARHGVALLRDAGHEIVWATAPWQTCIGWDVARRSWLRNNFGADPRDVVITQRKELVAGDVIIDDKPENVSAWHQEAEIGLAFLFTQPYNAAEPWIAERRFTWDAVPSTLL